MVNSELYQSSTQNSGLEKVLEKGRFASLISSSYSPVESNNLIRQAFQLINKGWGMYHAEELSPHEAKDHEGRVNTCEVTGQSGFYARIEYLPPSRQGRGRIRVSIPLRNSDGLETIDTPELNDIARRLGASGYR